ncbi:MAG: hypothetical protein PHO05_05685 [bacterium]|nr:hypothetical protein [bacterium]
MISMILIITPNINTDRVYAIPGSKPMPFFALMPCNPMAAARA